MIEGDKMIEGDNQDTYLIKLFNEFDVEGTGYLDIDQLQHTVSKITGKEVDHEELTTLMEKFDLDHDGKVSLDEFLKGCSTNTVLDDEGNQHYISSYSVGGEDYEKHLKFIFSLFDKDGDGLVSIDQLRQMLEDIKVKSGGDDMVDDENDDDDIEYIINTLSADGNETISFDSFMKAIEQINSPAIPSPDVEEESTSSFQPSKYINNNNVHHEEVMSDNELENNHHNSSFEDANGGHSRPESPSIESHQHQQQQKKSKRGRVSSWVAPMSIVNMIKRRQDLFPKEENEVFDSSHEKLVDQYKKRADKLRTENEHLGSKINMVEGQLREFKESHEKLSEDNAQLKETITIGKKTLIENQKLNSHNKKLEDYLESLKQQLEQAEEQKLDLLKSFNKLKSEKEATANDLVEKEQRLGELEKKCRQLEENADNNNISNLNSTFQSIPLAEVEKLQQENEQLRVTLTLENEKAQENIKLLSEQYQLLKKQSKDDRQLLESSNQIIHKLRTSLEELQSNGHGFDPNYKLSLLSELEQQVVTRLGSTPLPDSPIAIKSLVGSNDEQDSTSTTTTTTTVVSKTIPIKSTAGKSSQNEILTDDGDLSFNNIDDDEDSGSEYKIKYEEQVEKVKTLTADLESLESSTQQQISALNNQLLEQKKNTNQQIIVLQQSNQANTDQLTLSIDNLKQQLSDKENTIHDYQLKLDQLAQKSIVEKQEILENVEQLEKEIKSLNSQLESQNSSDKEMIQSLNVSIASLQAKQQETSLELEHSITENKKLKMHQEAFAKSIDTPSTQSDAINIMAGQTQSELSNLKARIEELSTKNHHLVHENTQLKQSLTPTSSPVTSSQDINASSLMESSNISNNNNNVESLQYEIKTLNNVKEQLEKDLQQYQSLAKSSSLPSNNNLIDEMKRDNEKVMEKFRVSEYEKLMIQEENKSLLDKSNTLSERIEMMKIEFETKLNQIQINDKLIKENDDLKSRLKKYESNDEHHIDIIELEDETKTMKAKIDDLSSKLQNERNLTKYLQGQLDKMEKSSDQDQTPLISNSNYKKNRDCCLIC
ncbi:hypothetical protein CYY_010081 [Polysphondylium violaceum]|uniref:EF-hand domain-containing protein n=1 Tax=Polysphondylium violaceum TaxID=133409 RepID=A0A8J4UUA0_9MYCE|nr:hypothetical protein CYY_010081 [Polysphondylium violaceum]